MGKNVTAKVAGEADNGVLQKDVPLDEGARQGQVNAISTLKSTLRPWLSVIVPSSKICSKMRATSL